MQVVFHAKNHYFKGEMPMQNQITENRQSPTAETVTPNPDHTIIKRIGSTNFKIRVFNKLDAKESINDKILRLIKNDIANGA